MSVKTIRLESLTEEELNFLQKKQEKEKRSYYFGMKIMAVVCLILPLITANILSLDKKPPLTFWESYIYTQIIMIIIFVFVMIATYVRKLFYINQDIKHQQKIIESVEIIQKKYMPHNQTFHFYINSQIKLSIEVSQNDFLQFVEGDEINIEYSQYSKEYFGYF